MYVSSERIDEADRHLVLNKAIRMSTPGRCPRITLFTIWQVSRRLWELAQACVFERYIDNSTLIINILLLYVYFLKLYSSLPREHLACANIRR